ncbi:helix-turn-helix domain-containing protein [Hyphomicrobium sp. 99]|uniref:helix-turn-helix domain-containing protein n=1 Tax=Hyphomicrobium sp. 99 TaxID=1163419 RepID=UPI0005F7B74A|nr:helix-turn-helix transcriptional regulator [Hyphomicrobium sp. 99]
MSKHPKPKSVDERLAEIREILADARRVSGTTQSSVADAMGLSNSQYSRIENGSTEMSLRQFLVACSEVHLEPSAVLGAREDVSVADLRRRLRASESIIKQISGVLKVGDKDAWDD